MASLKRPIRSGIFYTAIARYSNIVISILITAVLARLLKPEEFGTVAIAMVFITFFTYFGDFGVGPAIIQNKELSRADIESVFTFTISGGLLLSFLFFFGASLITYFYNEPELKNVCRILSVSVLFFSMKVVPEALNRKNLLFKKIGILSVIIQLVSGIVAVILALNKFGYYALVIRSVIDSLFLLIGNYFLHPVKLRFKIRKESVFKIWRFSAYQFMFSLVSYFTRNMDNLLIGKYFGTGALGFYDKAYSLMMMPVANLTNVVTPVLHPVLSGYQHDKSRILGSYLIIFRFLSVIGLPLSVFLYFSGSEIVNIIYGPQWSGSIPVFKILATIVGVQVIMSSAGSIFQATNKIELMFISGLISSTLIFTGILYGIFVDKSLETIATGISVAYFMSFFITYLFLIKGAFRTSLIPFMSEMVMPLVIALGVFLVNVAITGLAIENIYYSLILKTVVSGTAFMILFTLPAKNRKLFVEYKKKILKQEKS
ncbi:MAG: lipopolysaccharide biosynthesis protein [Prolixibacteraceae bacterium]